MSAMVTYCQVINSKDSSDLGLPAFPEMSLVSLASKMKMEISDASEASLKCLSWLYPSKLFSDDVSKRSENALKKCGLLDSTTQNDSKRNMEDVKVVKPVFKNVKAALSESGFVSNRMHEDFIHGKLRWNVFSFEERHERMDVFLSSLTSDLKTRNFKLGSQYTRSLHCCSFEIQ